MIDSSRENSLLDCAISPDTGCFILGRDKNESVYQESDY